jgi:hypothetical protein
MTTTTTRRYAGADWLRQAVKTEISPLGAAVADLLGDVFSGIYHIREEVAETDWRNPHCIEVRLKGRRNLATFDYDSLTTLVFLAHDRCIRVEISPRSHRSISLMFHQRQREGAGWQRHPTLEQAVATHRRYWPIEEHPDAQ